MKLRRPWYATMAAKIALSRLPLGYTAWRKLNLFSHGAMHDGEYAYGVFRRHFDRTDLSARPGGFSALELGPGDSVVSALVARAHGAAEVHLVDAGSFATKDMAVYRRMSEILRRSGQTSPDISSASSVDEVLRICNAQYATAGLDSLRLLGDRSVDFVWSQAVLEHVRRGEFLDTMRELRRVIRHDGMMSHRVDLKDHLGGALNNMRLPSRIWEAPWMISSGFYTNRLRFPEMLALFRQAGFEVNVVDVARWDVLPTRRADMAAEFRHFSDDALMVKEFDVVLRPAQ